MNNNNKNNTNINNNNMNDNNMNSNNNNNNNNKYMNYFNEEFVLIDYNVIKNSEITIEKAALTYKKVVYTIEVHYNNNIKSVDAFVHSFNKYIIKRLIKNEMIEINNESYDLIYSCEITEIIKYMLVKFHDVKLNELQYLIIE